MTAPTASKRPKGTDQPTSREPLRDQPRNGEPTSSQPPARIVTGFGEDMYAVGAEASTDAMRDAMRGVRDARDSERVLTDGLSDAVLTDIDLGMSPEPSGVPGITLLTSTARSGIRPVTGFLTSDSQFHETAEAAELHEAREQLRRALMDARIDPDRAIDMIESNINAITRYTNAFYLFETAAAARGPASDSRDPDDEG